MRWGSGIKDSINKLLFYLGGLRLSSIYTKYRLARVIIIEVVVDVPDLSLLLSYLKERYYIYAIYGVEYFLG